MRSGTNHVSCRIRYDISSWSTERTRLCPHGLDGVITLVNAASYSRLNRHHLGRSALLHDTKIAVLSLRAIWRMLWSERRAALHAVYWEVMLVGQ